MKLSEYIDVASRYRRSVNLVSDYGTPGALDGYVISPLARDTTMRLVSALSSEGANRAWTLLGPYGSGKSSFATFLATLLRQPSGALVASARQMFVQQWPELQVELDDVANRFPGPVVTITITGERAPLPVTILTAFVRAGREHWSGRGKRPNVLNELEILLGEEQQSPGKVPASAISEAVHEFLRKVTTGQDPAGGVLLIIDELGKLLEWAAHNPLQSDLFLLQSLAELASRSGRHRFGILTVVHQGFEAYARGLPRQVRDEWSKVEGRFELIPYTESPSHLLNLVAGAIVLRRFDGASSSQRVCRNLTEQLMSVGGPLLPKSPEVFNRCFPLNPITAVCLGPVFRLSLGQNERSLFALLTSEEPFGLRDYLRSTEVSDDLELFALDRLYDYLVVNTRARFIADVGGDRTIAAAEQAISRLPADAPELDHRVIKATAILSLVGHVVGLRADETILGISLQVDLPELKDSIARLSHRSALIYRSFKQSFQVWDGSDLDVPALIGRCRREVAGAGGYAANLQREFAPSPIAATRHAHRTGVMRFLSTVFGNPTSHVASSWETVGGDGLLVLIVPDSSSELESWGGMSFPLTELAGRRPVVHAFPLEPLRLLDAIEQFFAIGRALRDAPELDSDPVARRELEERRLRASDELADAIADSFFRTTSSNAHRWYWGEKELVVGTRPSQAASALFDQVYHSTPSIRNELVNRNDLSSAASGARRVLLERMFTHAKHPRLSIEGNPPELGIYLSVFENTKLHRAATTGEYAFSNPDKHSSVAPLWSAIHGMIKGVRGRQVTFQEIFDYLAKPPFGVRLGVAPLLVMAYFLTNKAKLLLYEDGTFVPDPGPELAHRLQRKPEEISIQDSEVDGMSGEVLSALSAAIFDGAKTASLVRIVREVVRVVARLSPFARQTARVSEDARRIRAIVSSSRDPLRLILQDLPEALGLGALRTAQRQSELPQSYAHKLFNGLRELLDIDSKLIEHLVGTLIRLLVGTNDTVSGLSEIKRCATFVSHRGELTLAVRRFVDVTATLDEGNAESVNAWTQTVCIFLTGKPANLWSDDDIARFNVAALDLAHGFSNAETFENAMRGVDPAADSRRIHMRVTRQDGTVSEATTILDMPTLSALEMMRNDIALLAEKYHLKSRDASMAVIAAMLDLTNDHSGKRSTTDER